MFFLIKCIKFIVIYVIFIIVKELYLSYNFTRRLASGLELIKLILRSLKSGLESQLGRHINILTRYTYLSTFMFFLLLNTLAFLLRPIFMFIIWPPYWIARLGAYLCNREITELKPNLETEWTHMFFYFKFSNHGDRSMDKLSKSFRWWFLDRVNVYSYFRVYNIIYVSLQRITNTWLGKYNMVTLLVIFIIIMGILFLIFVIEISLGPFKIIQSSLADTVVIAGTFLHKGVHESLARTIQGFRFREIHRIPGKRIYKNENSLFNFNPHKKHYLEKINYKLSSAPETSKYITDNNRFIEELSSGCDFLYGSIGDSRVNHGHFVWELNKNDSLNANLTAASNKYKLISILNKNECDANFPLLQFNIVGGGLWGQINYLKPSQLNSNE